ncbi:YncE family protein [Ancylobacter pratisalsi]|uniref:YncE family protein n=1 Tax=Ancylobacter pratisalsi TaxID=1745854 RepID=A0A6P1YND5_9HYPH|nr:YncE family protein [Ancylobacter pratisalsi]QIB34849.1 YncE family protein [Ancylobacter pratisalsi]
MLIDATSARLRPRLFASTAFAAAALVALAGAASAEPQFVTSAKPGPGLYELVFSAPMNRVYVAAAGSRGATDTSVVALDPTTLETKETIALGDNPVFGLAINNTTKTLYGTQTRDGHIAVVDLASGKVVAEIANGEKAHVRELAVDEGANRVYVTVTGRRDTPSAVWIIDGATNKVVGTIDDLPGSVTGISLDAKGKRLFLSAMESNEVHIVDLATNKLVKSFPSGGESSINLTYDASGDQVFVANQGSDNVTVLDAKDGTLIKTLPTGGGALSLAIDPERSILYVANRQGGYVSLVDTKTLEPIANVVTGSMPQTIAVDAASGNVYVSNKLKVPMRPRPPARPADGAPAAAPGATPVAASAGSPPPAAPRGPRVPMIDPFGDTVSLIKP